MSKCKSYTTDYGDGRCLGTKMMERCECGGDQRKCDFYPELRKQARAKVKTNKCIKCYRGKWRTDNPTIEGNYLVTMKYGTESPAVVTIARWVDNLRWFDWTTFDDERQGWVYPRGFEWVEAKYVIGWQPLPLPMEVSE